MAIIPKQFQLQEIVPILLNTGRKRILTAVILAIIAIVFADWGVGRRLSLGGLYIFPMFLAATALPSSGIFGLAVICALLKCALDDSDFAVRYGLRFTSSLLTYIIAGLFMEAVIRNRKMALEHLDQIASEQRLRNEAQERLKTLVESSPAAILTLDEKGIIVASNHAANVLFGLENGHRLEGRCIRSYVPMLAEALRLGTGDEPFRTAAQARGRRENGELFPAELWFSTYLGENGTQLAAIMVDCSEEMRDREQQNLQNLSSSSRLVVAAVLHEIRNLCSAVSVVYSNLKERATPCRVEEIQGLETLVRGLGRVASLELFEKEHTNPEQEVELQQVLDELRIIIEPNWQDIDGAVCWSVPQAAIRVSADRYGLMQVFLNLAQNSHRAVQSSSERKLSISLEGNGKRAALVTFRDTGCGIADPQHLFQPFQQSTSVTGLGLFISRALVRSYGGELWFQPVPEGCSFVVELPLISFHKDNA